MKELRLEDFGGKGDGKFDNTTAFAMAFSEIARNGGGKLAVTKGVWLTGPIDIPGDTTLEIQEGAEISFVDDPDVYTPVFTRWEGVECFAMHPMIYSTKQKNVTITGKGTINGNGKSWWERRWAQKKNGQKTPVLPIEKLFAKLNPGYENQPGGGGGRETQFLRPTLIEFSFCENVTIEGVKIIDSPYWTVHPLYVKNLVLKNLYVKNPADAPNTDGIDIDSCVDVKILDCFVSVGDDGICLKSGSGTDGIRVGKPTSNVFIKGCSVKDAHGGLVIGSETAAGINTVTAEDCDLNGTDRGIRIKSRRGRGGDIFAVHLKNISMDNTLCPIAINMYYKCGCDDPTSPLYSLEKQPVTKETPSIKDVSIIGVKAKNCRASAGFIAGLPEMPIDDLVIQDCEFSTDETSKESPMDSDMFLGLPVVTEKSFRVLNAPGAKFDNVKIEGPKEAFIYR
ncbi:MAG: glycoside hydrolase family 28 protein [Treponema sp.]|nr:glycoside hydrolase family 28 protein [Treponema sp.]